jgi:hypothetical protein
MKFEVGKTYKTKDGKSVRIVCNDRKSETHPLLGLIDRGSEEDFFAGGVDGKYYGTSGAASPMDLVPPPREFWINIYSEGISGIYAHLSQSIADDAAAKDRTECIKVREVREEE